MNRHTISIIIAKMRTLISSKLLLGVSNGQKEILSVLVEVLLEASFLFITFSYPNKTSNNFGIKKFDIINVITTGRNKTIILCVASLE